MWEVLGIIILVGFLGILVKFLMNLIDSVKRKVWKDIIINSVIFIVAICFYIFVMDAIDGFKMICSVLF